MCKQFLLVVCVLTVVCFTEATKPAFITKCKSTDSNCIKENANGAIPLFTKGISELKVETLDPVQIKFINASANNLLFVLNDITVGGLRNCEAKKIQQDAANKKIICKFLCSGTLDGQYELRGSLMFVPIEGHGKIHVDLNSAEINLVMNYVDKAGGDGKNYWHVKTWSHDFDLLGKSKVVFENLYNGNEVLGRAARELVANNSNDVVKEIGPPVIKSVVSVVVKNINHFFKSVPSEDLSLD